MRILYASQAVHSLELVISFEHLKDRDLHSNSVSLRCFTLFQDKDRPAWIQHDVNAVTNVPQISHRDTVRTYAALLVVRAQVPRQCLVS